ncbi:hypothetical protein VE02_09133 [Pseudogymnoascus sp. 03VT05]|nr:hypothetical protein VE02_09133 [Pseudogymnoascus sp. 03VT05]
MSTNKPWKKTPTRNASSRSPTRTSTLEEQPLQNNSSPPRNSEEDVYENILFFWPNIIGYARIILALSALYYMPLHPRTCTLLYGISCLLDALDGYAARYFNQSTRFGAVLDMVTDRCTTACLLVFLASAFPRWSIVFQGLISLDLASHYMHMYATLVTGAGESHKNVDRSRSFILNLYYTNKMVLFIFCTLNEVFFIALYLLSFSSAPLLDKYETSTPVAAPLVTKPWSAGVLELARANKLDSHRRLLWVVARASFPVMAGKQIINIIQLIKASRWVAEVDRRERRGKGLLRRRERR